MIIDLHQDWSDNSLTTTHKDFFSKEENLHGWNMEWMDAVNHATFEKLRSSGIVAVIGALFIDPITMEASDHSFSQWRQPIEAALYELHRHNKFYDYVVWASDGELRLIVSGNDLDECIQEKKMWLIKHIEWYYVQDPSGNMDVLDRLYDQWIRSVWMTRNINNNLAQASNDGEHTHWLTELWRIFVETLIKKWMILDLAHLSRTSVDDVLDIVSSPVMVSHTALTWDNDNHRFITPDQAKKVADKWWIIWLAAMKNKSDEFPLITLDHYGDQIKTLINLLGEDYVWIWTDFDWLPSEYVVEWFDDTSKYHLVQEQLLKKWLKQAQIEKVMWWNAKRFIQAVL